MSTPVDVAIIGAGPYGVSLAAHLDRAGVPFRIFGSPMRFWRDMPRGVALKSFDFATNVYAPKRGYSFVEYCRARGIDSSQPVDMTIFTAYGLWAQEELVPQVEDVEVVAVSRSRDGFDLELATGERARARRVVVAVGLRYFERLPDVLAALPADLVTHTARYRNDAPLLGRDVTVIGAGQSAIEAAALLHEHGARVRWIVRAGSIWIADRSSDHRTLIERLRNPETVLGAGRENWVLEHLPWLLHYAPEKRRVRFTRRHLGPFGTWWLRDKVLGQFPLELGTSILGARAAGGGVVLRVQGPNGVREIETEHVIAGTGYEPDVDRLVFLGPALRSSIARVERAPRLDRHFESSSPGLYFVGPSAAFSFGPLLRFVCGAGYAAPTVARRLGHTRDPRVLYRIGQAQA